MVPLLAGLQTWYLHILRLQLNKAGYLLTLSVTAVSKLALLLLLQQLATSAEGATKMHLQKSLKLQQNALQEYFLENIAIATSAKDTKEASVAGITEATIKAIALDTAEANPTATKEAYCGRHCRRHKSPLKPL